MRKYGYLLVWKRNFFVYRKSGLLANLWLFLEPLFYLLVFGLGIGSFIQNVDGKSYLDFFFPGLLITTAALIAFQESTSGYFLRSRKLKLYDTWMLLPIKRSDIFWGEILWSSTRGIVSAVGVAAVGTLLGLYQGAGLFAVLLVLIFVSVLFASLGMGLALRTQQSDSFLLPLASVLLPLISISGVLFPVSVLPLPLKIISYSFPLVHAVELSRNLIENKLIVMDVVHFAYLLVVSVFVSRYVYHLTIKTFSN
ncbi:MAG: ABC transporter permease [Bdellovibrionales bacterium]